NPSVDAPPGTNATDIARFNDDVANSAVNLDVSATINQLEFASGAGEYDFTGERLVISSSSGPDYIVHTAGNTQIFSNEVELASSGTYRDFNVGSGSTLVFEQKLIFSPTQGQIRVRGGGTIEILSGFTSLNIFNISGSGSTLNFRGNGGVNRLRAENGARINLFTSHGGDFTLAGNNASIHLRFDGNATGTSGSNTISVAPTNNNTVTLGADIGGGGTGTFTRNVRLFQANVGAPLVTNATIRFSATAGSTLNLSGVILDDNAAGGAGSKVEISGAGVVRYSGSSANTSVTPILISDGTLELAKDAGVNAIGGGDVTIEENGALRLAASHQIADATSLVFAGGLFDVGANAETLGALAVGADGGTIDFGGLAGSLTFASLSSIVGTLTIDGWSESSSITFTDGSGWNEETLALVHFTGFGAAQFDTETNRLFASATIPEPSSAALLIGSASLFIVSLRRRRLLSAA
ncbi:MAG: PEP-CTERM sorting domain-containing protein, partial [Verrucomicrobiota bacterium]